MLDKIGLGINLDMNDHMSRAAKNASRNLGNLQDRHRRMSNEVIGNTDRMTAALSRYARGFTVGFKLTAIGAAIEAPLVMLGMRAAQTEHSFNELRSLMVNTGLTADEVNSKIGQLQLAVNDVAQNTFLEYNDLLSGLYPLASKFGVDVASQIFEPVSKLAEAGKGTMLEAVRVMNQMFDTFGTQMPGLTNMEKAETIVNKLAGAIQFYDTDLMRLSEAMKYATPIAVQMGSSLEETVSIVGALTGVTAVGSKAGTAYEAFLRGIIQFTRRLNQQVESGTQGFREYIAAQEGAISGTTRNRLLKNPLSNIPYADAEGRLRPVMDIVQDIAKLFNITSETDIASLEQNQALMEAFQSEGVRAVAMLIKMANKVNINTKAIKDNNSAYDMAAEINKGAYSGWRTLTNTIKVNADTVGKILLPQLEYFLELATKIVKQLGNWAQTHKTATRFLMTALALLGVLFVLAGAVTVSTFAIKTLREAIQILIIQAGFIKSILWSLGNTVLMLRLRLLLMAVTTKLVTAAQWLWNAAMYANPIVWIIAAVLALGVGLYFLIKYWDDVKMAVIFFWEKTKEILSSFCK